MVLADSSEIAVALASVDEERFVRDEDGNLIKQSTAAWAIAQALERLAVRRDMRVLEIGTGSGYSTALLATLVGSGGQVVSVDVIPELVHRARALLTTAGLAQVSVCCADGAAGAARDAPFDRIIAWTTAPELPAAWIDQLAPGGLLVAPVALTPLSKTGAGVVVTSDGCEPQGRALFEAGYVEMHDQVLTQWDVPPYGADATRLDPQGRWWWLSAEHLRGTDSTIGAGLLDTLISNAHCVSGPLRAEESMPDFRNWLLATSPAGLTTAALGTPLWRIGYTDPAGAALLSTIGGIDLVTTGTAHQQAVADWVEEWRRAGRPGLADVQPYLVRTTTGWLVRARCIRR